MTSVRVLPLCRMQGDSTRARPPAGQAADLLSLHDDLQAAGLLGITLHSIVRIVLIFTLELCTGNNLGASGLTSARTRAGRRWRCPRPWPPAPAAAPPPASSAGGRRPAGFSR